MKNTMPRLIDDRRRNILIGVGMFAVFVASLALVGYDAWMRPYRARRAELAETIRDGEAFLAKMREDMAGGDVGGSLSEVAKRLEYVQSHVPNTDRLVSLEIDPSLFVEDDRPQATQIAASYNETRASAKSSAEDCKKLAGKAAVLLDKIRKTENASDAKGAKEAHSNLKQCIVEMELLERQSRPGVKETAQAKHRFDMAYGAAVNARASLATWREKAKSTGKEAEVIIMAAGEAAKRYDAATKRISDISAEIAKLRIDNGGERLASLREEIRKGLSTLEKAEQDFRRAKADAEKERATVFQKARSECHAMLEKARDLETEHGSFLPADALQKVKNGSNSLEAAIVSDEAGWKKFGDEITELLGRSNVLRDEAGNAARQLDAVINGGTSLPDVAHMVGLPESMAAFCAELSKVSFSAKNNATKRCINEVVSNARSALGDVEAGKPNVQTELANIKSNAKALMGKIESAKGKISRLKAVVADGKGTAKTELESRLERCAAPTATISEVRLLENASAMNGMDVIKLRNRLDSARKGTEDFVNQVAMNETEIQNAVKGGRFSQLVWADGAIGWPTSHELNKSVFTGGTLVPRGGPTHNSYVFEFGIDIPVSGEHMVEIRAKPTVKSVYNLNNAMPNIAFRGGGKGKRADGGWIMMETSLSSGDRLWSDIYYVPNKERSKGRGGDTLLTVGGTFAEGRAMFRLKVDLSVDMSMIRAADRIPDISNGWNLGGMAICIFLDGTQIANFWHRE